jgi:hypothetical protein
VVNFSQSAGFSGARTAFVICRGGRKEPAFAPAGDLPTFKSLQLI